MGYDSVANDVVMLGGQTFSVNGGAQIEPTMDEGSRDPMEVTSADHGV